MFHPFPSSIFNIFINREYSVIGNRFQSTLCLFMVNFQTQKDLKQSISLCLKLKSHKNSLHSIFTILKDI